MTDTFRALCAELIDDLEMSDWPSKLKETFRADIDRARAALAQPEPVAPMDKLDRLIALDRNDPIPNDLSHLSDAEFNALCPQGEHAPGPQPLSPKAQAVLDAATAGFWKSPFNSEGKGAAATIRAVINQVIAVSTNLRQTKIRAELLAIADELEGQ